MPEKASDKSAKVGYVCVKCSELVSEDCNCISCDWCLEWEHSSCANITETDLTTLGDYQTVAFFCSSCLPQVTEALSLYQTYFKLDDGLEKRFQSMENMFKTVCPDNLTSTSDELKVQLSDVTSQVKDLLSNNNQLQKQIETITTSLNDLHKKSYAAAVQASHPSLQYASESCSTQPSLGQSQLPGQPQPPTPSELRNAVSSVINEEKEK